MLHASHEISVTSRSIFNKTGRRLLRNVKVSGHPNEEI